MKEANTQLISWLTPELRDKYQKVFSPKFGRQLSQEEITEIACNLADFAELYFKHKWRNKKDDPKTEDKSQTGQ